MNRLVVSVAACALIAGAVAAATADRDPAPSGVRDADCRVREVLANHGADHVDDRLSDLRPHLKKPPVSAWQHFDLLTDSRLQVYDRRGRVELSGNTQLSITGDKVMVRNDLGAVVMTMTVRFDREQPQFFGGQKLEDGSQLLVLECY